MNNRVIKVVKRNKKDATKAAENAETFSNQLKKGEDENQQKAVSTLNNWIAEWREINRREKDIFAGKLSEWKAVSNL